jgi:hypothetical protein
MAAGDPRSSRRWRRTRAAVLASRPRCRCGRLATEAHHRRPLSEGGHPYDLSNVEPACADCQRAEGGRLGAASAFGALAPAGESRSWAGALSVRPTDIRPAEMVRATALTIAGDPRPAPARRRDDDRDARRRRRVWPGAIRLD